MLHSDRRFSITNIDDAAALAEQLANFSWCLCQGFRHRGYLLLNDAISEDAAQEFAAYKELADDLVRQVESYTISWMDHAAIERSIRELVAGNCDHMAAMLRSQPERLILQTPEQHGTCDFCR